jgi:uncharacterized Zn finger protein
MAPPPPRYVPLRPRFEAKPALAAKAKKVRGGVRLPDGDVASSQAWAAQRWLRLMEQAAEGPSLVAGLEYAHEGQTKRWSVGGAKAEAQIQGRAFRPYVATLTFSPIAHEAWEKVVHAMSENAMYAAKLLAGEMPTNIEDVFSPLALKLFPSDASEVRPSCTCGHAMRPREMSGQGDGLADDTAGWCKHVCCLAYLLAHRLALEPFLIFALRGLESHDLLDRLRQRRAVVGAALGATPIYQQRVVGVSDSKSPPLDDAIASFWELGASAAEVDLALAPPAVSQPLLRRLGPSPWVQASASSGGVGGGNVPPLFPLVGLLASCYETISAEVLREQVEPAAVDADAVAGDVHDAQDTNDA